MGTKVTTDDLGSTEAELEYERACMRVGSRKLVATFDITGWSEDQVESLRAAILAQGEESEEHPESHPRSITEQ